MGGVRRVLGIIKLNTKIGDIKENTEFCVIKDRKFEYDVLLGLDIKKFRFNLTHELKITQAPKINQNMIKENNNSNENEIKINNIELKWHKEMPFEFIEEQIAHLSKDEKNKIINLIDENKEVLAKNRYNDGTFEEQ